MYKKKKQELVEELQNLNLEYMRVKNHLDRITDITSGIIYMIDPNGIFTFLNRAVEEILHYNPKELIGKHFSSIMPFEEYQRVGREYVLPKFVGKVTGVEGSPSLFDERRTRDRRTKNLEIHLLTKEKREIKVLVGDVTGIMSAEGAYDMEMLSYAKDRDDAFIGSQGIIYDVTKYKRIEKEKMELQKHLLEVQKMDTIGRFAGGVAHDLNNKLGVIVGFADMLRKRRDINEQDLKRYLDTIIKSSRNAADLTSQLLSFAKEGTHLMVKVNFNDLIQETFKLLRPTVSKLIRIKERYHAENPILIGDPTELKNSILSLSMKLVSLMRENGDIVIATKEIAVDNNFAKQHSVISNTGSFGLLTMIFTGIAGEEFDKIKKIEQKYLQGADEEDGATGLFRAYQCFKKHKGFVEVVNEAGTGIKFDIYFPLVDDKSEH